VSTGTQQRIARNALVRSAGEVVAKVASLLFFVTMARELGREGFGAFMFALGLTTALLVGAGFGTDELTSREVARDHSRAGRYLSDVATLKKYDIVMLSCECGEHNETKPPAAKAALYDFMSQGGRVFASHYHYTWADEGPLASTADWVGSSSNPENKPGPYMVDQTFPKGAAFAEWLVNVQASQTLGEVPISQPRHDVEGVKSNSQRWVYRQDDAMTNYLTVNTPVNVQPDQQCGKFVFGDMHLYGGDVQPAATALPDDAFPGSCSKELTPEEKALVFLFFDLASCVQDDKIDPQAPIR
jgi:hypothetical protein